MKTIAKKIKQHLIDLAAKDKLPLDLNNLEWDEGIEKILSSIKQSDLNLDVIDNFILHLTHYSHNDIEGNVPFTITSNQLYKSARDYIEVDHVDGKGNEEDEISTDTIMSGIVCNKCKEEIPPHSVEQHLDPIFMENFHKCNS